MVAAENLPSIHNIVIIAFEEDLDSMLSELGNGERLIFGVSDNVPPDADLKRIGQITERNRSFGPVRPSPP
jgi:hypothetical protein